MNASLLIASACPGDGHVGEILVRDMLRCDGVDAVSVAALIHERGFAHCDRTQLRSVKRFEPPGEFSNRSLTGLRGAFSRIVARLRNYEPAIRKLAMEVEDFVREEAPEQLWVIADSLVSIDVGAQVAKGFDGRVLLQVWDDPRHILTHRGVDRFTRARTMRRFDGLLSRAERVAVICEPMAKAYASRTGASPIVIRHGMADGIEPATSPTSDSEFRIGISGSLYAGTAWQAFQYALDELNWKIGGKQVVLVVAGSDVRFRALRPARAEFHGWRSGEEVITLMKGCDLLYLPQPFEPEHEPLARLSFPTKLSTYAATGRPVFLHAPEYGSLTAFSREHGVGILCNDLDFQRVARLVSDVGACGERLGEQATASAALGSTVLNHQQFCRAVHAFLLGRTIVDDGVESEAPVSSSAAST